eukprot:s1400_g14.t1
MCMEKPQQPVNPHRQRLLSAASRAAKVDSKPNEKPEGAAAPKKPKAKAKAAAKTKATAKVKNVQVKADAQDAYNNAKKAFMTGFLAGWKESDEKKAVVASMPEHEAKRRRYI